MPIDARPPKQTNEDANGWVRTETAQRLRNCLALDSLVAWRIQLLTMLGRETPDLPCDVVFEDYEWKALYCYVHKTTEPPSSLHL
jgi:hypothetical protein